MQVFCRRQDARVGTGTSLRVPVGTRYSTAKYR